MNITHIENGPQVELKFFSAVPCRVVAAWMLGKTIYCTYPRLPLEVHPGKESRLLIFTNCEGIGNLTVVSTSTASTALDISKLTVNCGRGFDPRRTGFSKTTLPYAPEFTHGFVKFGGNNQYLLALSGDLILRNTEAYSAPGVMFTPDICNLYTELGALRTEQATLEDMQAPQDLIAGVAQKIHIIETTLQTKLRRE